MTPPSDAPTPPAGPYTVDAYAAFWSTVEATPPADAARTTPPAADARDPYTAFCDVAEL